MLLFRRKQKSISDKIRTYLFPKESQSCFYFCSPALRDHCRFKKCQVFKSKQDLLKMHRWALILLSERSFALDVLQRKLPSCSIQKRHDHSRLSNRKQWVFLFVNRKCNRRKWRLFQKRVLWSHSTILYFLWQIKWRVNYIMALLLLFFKRVNKTFQCVNW